MLFCVGGMLVIAVSALLLSAAPYLVESILLPRLEKNIPGVDISAKVQHLTPLRFSGNVEIGQGGHHFLSLPHLELTYTPTTLIHGRLSSLLVDGLTLRLKFIDGRLILQENLPHSTDAQTQGFAIPPFPVAINTLHLINCHIFINRGNLPAIDLMLNGRFDLDFIPLRKGGYSLGSVKGHLRSEGGLIAGLELWMQSTHNENRVHLNGEIDRLAGLFSLFPGSAKVTGKAKLDLKADLSGDFKIIKNLKSTISFPSLVCDLGSFHLKLQGPHPLQLNLSGTQKGLQYELVNLKTSGSHSLEASLHGDIYPAKSAITGTGQIHSDDISDPVSLSLSGSIHNRQTNLEVHLSGNRQVIPLESKIPIHIGQYHLTTHLHHDSATTTIFQQVDIETTEISKYQLRFKKIAGRLTFNPDMPAERRSPFGEISIDGIAYKGQNLAKFKALMTPIGDGLSFTGKISGLLGTKPSLLFHGTASKHLPLTLSYKLPQVPIDRNSLPASLALPSDAAISGKISASGTFEVSPKGSLGQLNIALKDGSFELPDKKIHLFGINCKITLPHLPEPASDPSQLLTIDRMDINNLKFSSGKIFFRLEDNGTLFLEKSRFNWCHGKVESDSLRLTDSTKELSTTFYCDRLSFAELLSQLGISGTEGRGSLNGRLPITLSSKGLIFGDGFLFSTPGNNGIVRFNNSEMLRQGIAGATKTAVLDYSIQALQNFAYNWTKLTFKSQGGDLLVSMKIDGKPASPLPYGYSKGQLVAQENGPGLQHPIRLDINFHLPLAQMFKYGQSLQKLMEKIQ